MLQEKAFAQDTYIYEPEFDPNTDIVSDDLPVDIHYDQDTNEYVVEGPRVEKMLGYTNLETEKGLAFLQRFIEDNGIHDQLKALGIHEGDMVRMYGHTFEYYV